MRKCSVCPCPAKKGSEYCCWDCEDGITCVRCSDEIFLEAQEALGTEEYDRLIQTERKYNQRHWARRLRNALEPNLGKVNAEQRIRRVESIILKMEEEADKYDEG